MQYFLVFCLVERWSGQTVVTKTERDNYLLQFIRLGPILVQVSSLAIGQGQPPHRQDAVDIISYPAVLGVFTWWDQSCSRVLKPTEVQLECLHHILWEIISVIWHITYKSAHCQIFMHDFSPPFHNIGSHTTASKWAHSNDCTKLICIMALFAILTVIKTNYKQKRPHPHPHPPPNTQQQKTSTT